MFSVLFAPFEHCIHAACALLDINPPRASSVQEKLDLHNNSMSCGGEPEVKRYRRDGSSGGVVVVLGGQWGDEGKGKLVDILAQDADVVCRCQVRNNATKSWG